MADNKIMNHDETIGLIRAKKEDSQHGDCFDVRVLRRIGPIGFAGRTENIATLGQATLQHIANPETWLPKLVGGGNLILKVFSPGDPGKQLGGDLGVQISGDAKPVDPAVLKLPNWNGPIELKYPEVGPAPAPPPYVTLPSGQIVPAPPPAPQQTLSQNIIPPGPSNAELELKDQLRAQQALLAQLQGALAARDKDLAEERAARREEQMRRENAAAMASLEAKIERLAVTATQPQKNPVEAITAIATALAPLVQSIMQSGQETRLAMLKSQQESTNNFNAILLKSMEKPTIDPAITAMTDRFAAQIEKLRTDDSSKGAVSQMADAFGGMTSMMMGILREAVDSGIFGGKQESTGMAVVKEIAKAIESFGKISAAQASGRRPKLPANVPPKQPPAAATATGPQQPAPSAPQQNGFAGVVNPLDDIERRIRAEEDPDIVAAAFIAVIRDPAVQAEIEAAGGIVKVFTERLGTWANDHVEYGTDLLAAIEEKGIAAGVMTADDDETVEAVQS